MLGFSGKRSRRCRASPFIITLSSVEKLTPVENSRKYTAPSASVVKGKIVVLAAAVMAKIQIFGLVDIPLWIVTKWRKRFYDFEFPSS